MEKRMCSRRELVDRWRGIEEEEEQEGDSLPLSKQKLIRQMKEEWFSDTFKFLINPPAETHLWCGCWDLMTPLLETFHSYFKDKDYDSPLKLIWKRVSKELGECTQCICQHHQAQETYYAEYESDTVGPLLKVLRCLDEERVTGHIKEINARIVRKEYDPECHSAEVVGIMFEVLMFPILLDDQELVTEFESFIEAIDNSHEVSLSGHQQYPGVYALLFLKNARARAIGLRLSRSMGKLRRATDLEPLQPLLRKCIAILETEVLPSNLESPRPKVQLERITVWHGVKTLLAFLEAPAFEEGILERYPVFLSIVLNHVSDDTPEFSYAVTCLRLFFEMLGCKLWLRTTLSPSVMRNTLLGQCFHTRNEKSHKEIFDLFLPFLQSLEALQDGEHEKQRRHFIYFLLHQVTQSSNFSVLMRKNARKIALLVIHRGYKMNPPCPPFKCAHMWGPSLVSSLKDSSLHSSLRQPAFDLIQTIIVSDCAALLSLKLNHSCIANINMTISSDLYDDEDEDSFSHDIEEKENSCWNTFSSQSKLAAQECRHWRCTPMLWFEVFVEVDPSMLPISFSKAVVWAISHFSLTEPDISMELKLSVRDWLASYAGEISSSFVWEIPNGSDDGGDGKETNNSVKASVMCTPLIKAFKRCAAHFITMMEQRELQKQWTWEPRMAESLVLLLIDPNDTVRQANRIILEHISNTRGLTPGLQFLCSNSSSFSAMYMGLKYAAKQVQLDCSLTNFHNLHHLFFIVRKLLKEVVASPQHQTGNSKEDPYSKSEGGFLRKPCVHSPVSSPGCSLNMVDVESWNKFSCMLSAIVWPSILNCLSKGKKFLDIKSCQMTCVRLLETIPVVFDWISSSLPQLSQSSEITLSGFSDFNWLFDLVDWGKSSLVVVFRHWKQSILCLLNLLKRSQDVTITCSVDAIQKIMSCDTVAVDELKEHVSQIMVSLSKEAIFNSEGKLLKAMPSVSEPKCIGKTVLAAEFSSYKTKGSYLKDAEATTELEENRGKDGIIVLSDDEDENLTSPDLILSSSNAHENLLHEVFADKGILTLDENIKQDSSTVCASQELVKPTLLTEVAGYSEATSRQEHNDGLCNKPPSSKVPSHTGRISTSFMNSKVIAGKLGTKKPYDGKDTLLMKGDSAQDDLLRRSVYNSSDHTLSSSKINAEPEKNDNVIKELVCDEADDPLGLAIKSAGHSKLTKPSVAAPKRKVVQLQMPINDRPGYVNRMGPATRRLKPPRLDDWYRPILELDYFSIVGLYSDTEDNTSTTSQLKEVPLCFHSLDHYVEIFRPLVLEEFKAQLHNSYAEASSSDDMYSSSLCVLSVERIDDFHLVRGCPEESEASASRGYTENDLVLFTKDPLQSSAQPLHALGKVERRERNNKTRSTILIIRFYFQAGSSRLNKMRRILIERSKWHVTRIMSITPQLREFQALSSLNDIPLLPIILNPVDSSNYTKPEKVEIDKLSQPLQKALRSSFNDSQLQAISVAVGGQGFSKAFELSLIQGPPGTGKTKTIVAIVSALLATGPPHKGASLKMPSNSSRSYTSFSNLRAKVSQAAAIARAWQDAAVAKQIIEDELKDNSGSMLRSSRGRILICAQSNAAVDELVSRINCGLYGNDGKMYKPYLVRVGNVKTVHPVSLPFFIDTLVEQRLAENNSETEAKKDTDVDSSMSLRAKLEKIVDSIRQYESMRAKLRDRDMEMKPSSEDGLSKVENVQDTSDAAIGIKLNSLYAQKRAICGDIASAQARERNFFEESKLLKIKIRKSILKEAEIVVTTLSGCGGDIYGVCSDYASSRRSGNFSEHSLFDAVVIDEAAQALEPATLIPLQLLKSNGTKCIMVGDPKQLPATVLSNVASKFLYECSMFERLQRAGHPVVMLTEQYRMHPEICKFPSSHFYENKLLNGTQMSSKSAPFHEVSCLGPYVFFDVIDGHERQRNNSGSLSLYNEAEAEAAVEILKLLRKRYFSEFSAGRIGIITPYKSQLSVLRSRFSSEFGSTIIADMEFNTVDGFQGREVDILLLSTVRASDPRAKVSGINSSRIGFVADVRRMNVALTRAKHSLWIFGNAKTLQTNLHWAALIKDAKERKLFSSVSRPYRFSSDKALSLKERDDQHNLDYHARHQKHGEKLQGGRSGVQHNNTSKGGHREKAKTVSLEPQKQTGGSRPDGGGKQKISSQTYMPSDGHLSETQKSMSTSEKGLVNNPEAKGREIRREKDHSSAARHSTKEKITLEREERQKIQADMQLKNNPTCKTKIKKAKTLLESSRHASKAKAILNQEASKTTQTAEQLEDNLAFETKTKKAKAILVESSDDYTSKNPSQKRLESSQSCADSQQEKEGVCMDKVSTAPTDLMATRKRQRDAVDSLLSSAFISSKKPEVSSKPAPVRRPLPQTSSRVAIRPARPNKGRPDL